MEDERTPVSYTHLDVYKRQDMDIHSITEYEPFDPMAFERKALTEKRGLIPQIEPRYRYPYFCLLYTSRCV